MNWQYLVENHPTKPSKIQWSQSLVMRLREGDFFGEIALLSGKPRQATVKASGKVAVLVIGRDAFTRLCGSLINILQRSMSNYSCVEISAEGVQGAMSLCLPSMQSRPTDKASNYCRIDTGSRS